MAWRPARSAKAQRVALALESGVSSTNRSASVRVATPFSTEVETVSYATGSG